MMLPPVQYIEHYIAKFLPDTKKRAIIFKFELRRDYYESVYGTVGSRLLKSNADYDCEL